MLSVIQSGLAAFKNSDGISIFLNAMDGSNVTDNAFLIPEWLSYIELLVSRPRCPSRRAVEQWCSSPLRIDGGGKAVLAHALVVSALVPLVISALVPAVREYLFELSLHSGDQIEED